MLFFEYTYYLLYNNIKDKQSKMNILQVKNLTKNYVTKSYTTEVLKNLDFSIQEGDFLVITGPSGSGKTTLLNCISGLESITSGSVLLKGVDLAKMDQATMAKTRQTEIGFVFQAYNLLPNLTLYENIAIAMVISGNLDKGKILGLLDKFGLLKYKDYFPNQVSGGMQQRCAIVRALINDPAIIFADEPTGNLDSKSSLDVLNTFKMLHDEFGKTIVMVTHSLDHLKYGTRHIQIIDGQIQKDEKI